MGLTWRQGGRQGLSMAICGYADLAAKTSMRAAKCFTIIPAASASPFLAAPAAF